jgi:RecB family exonuclease
MQSRPHLFVGQNADLARRAAFEHLRQSSEFDPLDPPVIFTTAGAAPHWRRLFRENGSAIMPRLLRAEEFFVRSHATNARMKAVSGRDRLWILTQISKGVAPHLEHLSKAVSSREWLQGLAGFIAQMRRSNVDLPSTFEWKREFEIIFRAYDLRLAELNAFDAEAAPALFSDSVRRNEAFQWPRALIVDDLDAVSPSLEVGLQALFQNAEVVAGTLVAPGKLKENPAIASSLEFWRRNRAKMVGIKAPKMHHDRCASKILGEDNGAAAPDHVFLTPCHTMWEEMMRIAAHIRREVDMGASLEQFTIAIPSAQRYEGVLQAAFKAHDVPVNLPFAHSLSQLPLIRRLLLAFESCKNVWNVHALHDLIGDGTLQFESLDATRLRKAAIAARHYDLTDLGRAKLAFETKIEQIRGARRDEEERREAIKAALDNDDLGAVERLKTECAGCFSREKIGGREWLSRLDEMISQLAAHWLETPVHEDAVETHEIAQLQLKQLREVATAVVERANNWSGDSEEIKRDSSDWLSWLHLECESGLVPDSPKKGAVPVVNASNALEWSGTVFFAGLSEGVWPSPTLSGPLAERGRDAMEHLRSHECSSIARATHILAKAVAQSERLYLSYPQNIGEREAQPSPLIEDLRALWENHNWPQVAPETDLAGVKCPTSRWSWLAQAATSNLDELYDWDSGSSANVDVEHLKTLHIMREQRRAENIIGVYDGVLGKDGRELMRSFRSRKVELTGRGSDAEIVLSASALESYARCPLRYFFERVLELKPEDSHGDDLDAREIGNLVHDILFLFHCALLTPLSEVAFENVHKLMLWKAKQYCDGLSLRPILREAEYHRLVGLNGIGGPLWKLLQAELNAASRAGDGPWDTATSPIKNIPVFKSLREETSLKLGLEQKFELNVGGVKLTGTIDRIDASIDGSLVVVLDYKTGGVSSLPTLMNGDDGLHFQLALYALKVREYFQHLPQSPRFATGFLSLKSGKFAKAIGQSSTLGRDEKNKFTQEKSVELETDKWENWLDGVQKRIKEIASHIEKGTFNISLRPQEQAKCAYCEFAILCGQDSPTQAARFQYFEGNPLVYLPIVQDVKS